MVGNNLNVLNNELKSGWNTWDTNNIMSYTLLPEGFSINIGLKDYAKGKVFKNFLIGNSNEEDAKIYPDIRSYDGSYIEYDVSYNDIKFKVQSTVVNKELLVLVTPLKAGIKTPTIFVEVGVLWNNEGYVYKEDNMLFGNFNDNKINVNVAGEYCDEKNLGINNPYIALNLSQKIAISTQEKYSVKEIEEYISKAKQDLIKSAEKYGDLNNTYLAMKSCIAWDTIYEPAADEICSPVSRIWNVKWGGYILFCWDTFFAAAMIALEDKDLAYSNVFAILNKITKENFVPGATAGNGFITLDRSQPPVGSMTILKIYNMYKEKWFVEETFYKLARWNDWFARKRMIHNGTLCWGSNPYEAVTGNQMENIGVNKTYGAAFESGLDNSPMYDDVPFNQNTKLMELSDVGLTGLFIQDCKCLIKLAKIIGEDYKVYQERLEKAESGLQSLWCESYGLFLNKRTDTNEFSYRISPTNFYSLFSDNLTDNQVSRMINEHFYNEDEFWGEYIIPSISKNDKSYKDQDYWRGRIWGPMNYLVYEAMNNYKLDNVCKDIADKSNEIFLKEWTLHKHVHENYSAKTGMGCDVNNSDKFYHWGGLLGFISIIEKIKNKEINI